MERLGQKQFIVMGPDDMAYLFTDTPESARVSHDTAANDHDRKMKEPGDQSLADRLLREFKSFLPKVTRVRPMEAVFPTGRAVRLAAPVNAEKPLAQTG